MTYTRCHGDGEGCYEGCYAANEKLIGGSEMNMPQTMLLSRAAIYNNSYNSLGFHFCNAMARSKLGMRFIVGCIILLYSERGSFDELAAAASRLIDEAEQAHLTPAVQPAAGYPYMARR